MLGRSINLHNQLYNVVGVMPAQMSAPSGVDVWVPIMRRAAGAWENRENHPGLFAWGRLKKGVSIEQAQSTNAGDRGQPGKRISRHQH